MHITNTLALEATRHLTDKEFYQTFTEEMGRYLAILQPSTPFSAGRTGQRRSKKIEENAIYGLIQFAKFSQLHLIFTHFDKAESKAGSLYQRLKAIDKRRAIKLKDLIIRNLNQWLVGPENRESISDTHRGIDELSRSSTRVPDSNISTLSPTLIQRPPGLVPPTAKALYELWVRERGTGKVSYQSRETYGDCFDVATQMARKAKESRFQSKVLYTKGSHEFSIGRQGVEAFSRGWGKKYGAPWKKDLTPRFDHIVKIGSTFYFKIYEGEYVLNEKAQKFQLVELMPGMLIYTASELGPYKKADKKSDKEATSTSTPKPKSKSKSKKRTIWQLRHMVTYYKDGMVLENYRNPEWRLRRLTGPPNIKRNWQRISAWKTYDRSDGRSHPDKKNKGHWPHPAIVKTGEGEKKKGQFNVVVSIKDPYYSGRFPKPRVIRS
ncbi:MAG: hypothetical protein AAF587_06090 [Bacteroidota bacterium]